MRWSRERVPASIRILVAALATIVVAAAVSTAAGAQGSDPDVPVSSEQARAAVRDDLRSHPDILTGGTGRQRARRNFPKCGTVNATLPRSPE